MPKKVCPNGHIYDSSIYGDECPLCPKGGNETQYSNQPNFGMPPYQHAQEAGGTMVSTPAAPQQAPGGAVFGGAPQIDASGDTVIKGQKPQPKSQPMGGGKTIIRQPQGQAATQGRKLVGFLITYTRNPLGKAYNIYEGKNFIGRDRSCDIAIPEDNQMSGKHMSILYRNVDNKFKYKDEQSSNGTFVNKELSDEGVLENHDLIRLGSTVFLFIAIPKLG